MSPAAGGSAAQRQRLELRPALKYSIVGILFQVLPDALWEYQIYQRLQARYEPSSLLPIRDDLVSFATIGWVIVTAEREFEGRLVRRYALSPRFMPFIEHQLDLPRIIEFLEQEPGRREATTP